MRKAFFEKLDELMLKNRNVFMITADLGGAFFKGFKEKHPRNFINAGIAEENMVGIASGLAMADKIVYCYSISPFLTLRALENIRLNIAYPNFKVRILGAGGGLSYGLEGFSHHGVEDISVMKSLPNMAVVCPSDRVQAKEIAKMSINYPGPLYIRFGQDNPSGLYLKNKKFKIGRAEFLTKERKIVLAANGSMVEQAKLALAQLAKEKIFPALIDFWTVKPLDKKAVAKILKSKFIFSIEEHSKTGGFGDSLAVELLLSGYKGVFLKIALPSRPIMAVGKREYLLKKNNLDYNGIAKTIKEKLLKR
jgi:transketolase